MKTRRDFVKLSVAAVVAGAGSMRAANASAADAKSGAAMTSGTGAEDRGYWCGVASRIATPVLDALSRRKLKAEMPVEAVGAGRAEVTHLEAVGRLLCGIAPWLELGGDTSAEGAQRKRFAELARAGIDAGTDPRSPDFLNFSKGRQPLVDAAFLAQAMLRAPKELWEKLEPRVRQNVIAAMKSSRGIQPGENNWKLFATTVEVFLQKAGEMPDPARLRDGIDKHRDWYVGDGMYGDGPEFHWDYYNSFVIQPMLVEALDVVGDETPELKAFQAKARERLTRWAQIQERLVAADGSYPVIGRSIAYRCGAFQGLALAAWRHALPKEISPAQARVALTRVIRRTMEAPGTFDAKGWLQLGLAGHQRGLAEGYISTGSLYLCSVAFLPLGLAEKDAFWSAPAEKTTWEKVWAGEDLPADHALKSPR